VRLTPEKVEECITAWADITMLSLETDSECIPRRLAAGLASEYK
jgi:hypothetical protein